MTQIIHRAENRGHINHDWLDTFHSFSFGEYFNPERMWFGMLRVINDDIIAPGAGFGKHPHSNMEIITIPLSGALEHQDSMGHTSVIRPGEVQVMSAGTGVFHSEYNASETENVTLLQIWVRPKLQWVKPRYDQYSYLPLADNSIKQIVSPDIEDESSWMHQDVWFHIGKLDAKNTLSYNLKKPGNGIYFFVIDGNLNVEGTELSARDALGITETDEITLTANTASEFLIIEVPMAR